MFTIGHWNARRSRKPVPEGAGAAFGLDALQNERRLQERGELADAVERKGAPEGPGAGLPSKRLDRT